MKKIFAKLKIILMIFLVLFTFFHKPKPAKADALVAGGGMYLISLNPAILPIAVIGLIACLLVGFTISNWDEVTAFGNAVNQELLALGGSIGDYVHGTSVKIDSTLKQAIFNAYGKTGKTLPKYTKTVDYSGGTVVHTGLINGADIYGATDILDYLNTDFRCFGNVVNGVGDKSNLYIKSGQSEKVGTIYYLDSITVTVTVLPTSAELAFFDLTGFSSTDLKRDSSGKVIEASSTLSAKTLESFLGSSVELPYSLGMASTAPVTITDVTIPELGIGSNVSSVSTSTLKSTAIKKERVNEYMDTAFPTSTSVKFKEDTDVRGITISDLANVSNGSITNEQAKALDDIQANAVSENTGSSSSAGSSSGFWSLLWDWLLKILNAILGIPSAILDVIKVLFATVTDWLAKIWQGICDLNIGSTIVDWLSKLWTGICSIPSAIVSGVTGFWEKLLELVESIVKAIDGFNQAIANAITGALEWCFGLDESWLKGRIETLKKTFDSKFPALKTINYKFSDKSSFDDLKMTVPYCGQVTVVESSIVMKYGSVLKNFLRAFFYLITALFFFKRFHKVAED
jgi:hypothetical protein